MSPIPRYAVRLTQRIKNSAFRNRTLDLVEEATKQPDLAHFTRAILKNPAHTSHTDPREHATAMLATEEQAARNRAQTIHIYFDPNGRYIGHMLYPERDQKPSDD
ncbi:hypothetical protein W97_04517 [Coniosporium apollinis CBS 100218]|uniref:Uncharacterized protein n=1 Tax=Coniosporium apollinis (strain CBS 100218) TaxID=1168221 RepID=R7YTY7_CONA1|nr:uncharacterized protein W97_04517 [Coniosporium apollinis CBS 100218]EON65279.1 hypothetical protein W97_04517 [Coniosporium apollinis CBS 100218]